MASRTGSSHSFQKLKLDTAVSHKAVPSSFASYPRQNPCSSETAPLHLSTAQPSSFTSEARKTPDRSEETYTDVNAGDNDSDVAVGSSEEEGRDVERWFRARTTSISFSDHAIRDDGLRHSLKDPLPKPQGPPPQLSTSSGDEFSDRDYLELPLGPRRRTRNDGESSYPVLPTHPIKPATVSSYGDKAASPMSEATASPWEEARTPLDTPGDYLLSPSLVTSPIEFPPFTQGFKSQRSRRRLFDLGEGEGISRRQSRRSSGRSGPSVSSMSPAASFLARYKSADSFVKMPEPDDEGQGIGYDQEYIIGKQVGYGGFSVVKEVTSIEHGQRQLNAVKIVRKQLHGKLELENEDIQTQFDHEVDIWRYLHHQHILPLLRVYSTDFATFCITKLVKGGTLFDLVRALRMKKASGLSAPIAKQYMYQLASALRYLHNDAQVVHRDIKLENCLLDMSAATTNTQGGNVLLCDFGLADYIVSDARDSEVHDNGSSNASTYIAGSLPYAAPELFTARSSVYSPAADVWAFGVVCYALLTASLPFNEGLDVQTIEKIKSGSYAEDAIRQSVAAADDHIEEAVDLIRGCLDLHPATRLTIQDILDSPWLKNYQPLSERD